MTREQMIAWLILEGWELSLGGTLIRVSRPGCAAALFRYGYKYGERDEFSWGANVFWQHGPNETEEWAYLREWDVACCYEKVSALKGVYD